MLVVVVQAFGACWASWARVSPLACWGRRSDSAHTSPPRDPKRPRRALRHWDLHNNIFECTINPKQAFITHFLPHLLRHLAQERGGPAWSGRRGGRVAGSPHEVRGGLPAFHVCALMLSFYHVIKHGPTVPDAGFQDLRPSGRCGDHLVGPVETFAVCSLPEVRKVPDLELRKQ